MRSVTLEVVVVVEDRFSTTALAYEIHELIDESGFALDVDSVKVVREGAIDAGRHLGS